MRNPKRNPEYDGAFKDRPALTQVINFSPIETIAAPLVQPTTPAPRAPQLTPSSREEKRTL